MGKNIINIINKGLCIGCGTCISLCPHSTIGISIDKKKGIYIPLFDDEKECQNCGICLKVCPGHEVNFKELNIDNFAKEPENLFLGNFLNCFIGHSEDEQIRFNSSSGGLITQLLIYALDSGMIDGALVTRMKKDKPLEPEPFIARTRDEIIEASKSKYCPVPTNIKIKEILNSNKEEKFAYVGLPCHIHGLKKAGNIKNIKKKFVLILGIFCGHVPNFLGTEILLKKLNVNKRHIKKLDYRGNGWPGYMKIKMKNNELIKQILPNYWEFTGSYFFYPNRCLTCIDGTCEFADISFGDAWLPECSKDTNGISILVSRTEIGNSVLKKISESNIINITHIKPEKVIQSQLMMLYLKKTCVNGIKIFSKNMPNYNNPKILSIDITDIFIYFFIYFNSQLATKSVFFRKILLYVPFKIIWLYFLPSKIIMAKKADKYLDG